MAICMGEAPSGAGSSGSECRLRQPEADKFDTRLHLHASWPCGRIGSRPMDALVVGAGPTGLLMAAELARRGLQVRVIDRDEHAAIESRALWCPTPTRTCAARCVASSTCC